MKISVKEIVISIFFIQMLVCRVYAGSDDTYSIRILKNNNIEVKNQGAKEIFKANFVILYSENDPKFAYKNLKKYSHFAPSWKAKNIPADKILVQRGKNEVSGGDGVDKTLDISKDARTFDIFYSAEKEFIQPEKVIENNGHIQFSYKDNDKFDFYAELKLDNQYHIPQITYHLKPKVNGFFSVGYVGSNEYEESECDEIWQPFIWKQKLFPDLSYLTPAFLCPVPSTLVQIQNYTYGVVVPPEEFPFQPLPTRDNSLFGVSLRSFEGKASPMVFAPVLGQMKSEMKQNDDYNFSFFLYVKRGDLINSFTNIATQFYGFEDYRNNEIITVNKTLDNIIDYSLSEYSNFIDSLRGCSYATDVPGSVKNVSALNPLEIALVTDNKQMFDQRALPIMEFMLSRDKELFSLNTKIKTQNPSRKMGGPCTNTSELAVLYHLSGQKMSVLLDFIGDIESKSKPTILSRNWNFSWQLYNVLDDQKYLDATEKGVSAYINTIGNRHSVGYWDQLAKLVQLVDMYETTRNKTYLEAARKDAYSYAMNSWFSPAIPDQDILVNENGKAPMYWYLARRGFEPQNAPEETVPAWRLSEIGLLPESTITCIGHRGVFMAQHAPVFLRIANYADDDFLRSIARSAIVGRYRNFPGYHMNTQRNTAYEQADFPLREHHQITVGSMHYNHIMVMASNLIDYLVSDVFDRSNGQISFGSSYISGYGYLSNRFYGYDAGQFYNYKNVSLWMPKGLLKTSSVELNYIAARDNQNLYLAFTNQLKTDVNSTIQLNTEILPQLKNEKYEVEVYQSNKKVDETAIVNGKIELGVKAKDITAIVVKGLNVKPKFQQEILTNASQKVWSKDHQNLNAGNSTALLINLGEDLKSVYLYLRDDDSKIKRAELKYLDEKGVSHQLEDNFFPFEFRVKLERNTKNFKAILNTVGVNGETKSEEVYLHQ